MCHDASHPSDGAGAAYDCSSNTRARSKSSPRATRAIHLGRLGSRPGHFMPASLLASQLEALEPLESDEAGVRVENVGSVEQVVSRAIAALGADW